jgi:hypothetical protein
VLSLPSLRRPLCVGIANSDSCIFPTVKFFEKKQNEKKKNEFNLLEEKKNNSVFSLLKKWQQQQINRQYVVQRTS